MESAFHTLQRRMSSAETGNALCIWLPHPKQRQSTQKLERVTGIEPAQPAWKAGTLPLSYTRSALTVKPYGRAEARVRADEALHCLLLVRRFHEEVVWKPL